MWFDIPAFVRVQATSAEEAGEIAGRFANELHRSPEGWSVVLANDEPIDVTDEVEE